MSTETDLIRLQMQETRTGLADKLETLENRVTQTVAEAQAKVVDTVTNVKESVEETVAVVTGSVRDTVESVKSAFDVSGHVERHPLLCLGGAVAVGYFGGRLLESSERKTPNNEAGTVIFPAPAATSQGHGPPAGEDSATPSLRPAAPSWWHRFSVTFGEEFEHLASLAIGV